MKVVVVVVAVAEAHQTVGVRSNPFVAQEQAEDLTVAAVPCKPGFDAAAAAVVIAVSPSQFDDHLQSLVG